MRKHENFVIDQSDSASTETFAAIGGVIGAILAASCCVVPLVLVTLGVTGAWIGSLTVLEPYKPIFAVVALGLLGFGFWHSYFKPRAACKEGSYCAHPKSTRLTRIALWVGTVIVMVALSIDYWAPLFY